MQKIVKGAQDVTPAPAAAHIIGQMWRGLLDSTRRGAFWVALTLYAIAFAITYKYPDQSILSLDKIIYGLATITAVFNWGRATQQEADDEKYLGEVERERQMHSTTVSELTVKHQKELDSLESTLMEQVSIQAGLLQRTTQSLAESLHDIEQKKLTSEMLPERLKMLVPQYSQAILILSDLCEENPADRRERQERVEIVIRQNTGIEHRIGQINGQAQQLLAKLNSDPSSYPRLAADVKKFLAGVVSSSESLSEAVRETAEVVAVLDKKGRVPTEVPCPKCGTKNTVLLAQYRGAAATGNVCGKCGQAFNAHVAAAGPFTVAQASNAVATQYVPMKCPNPDCIEPPFNVATIAGDSRKEERGCFGCGAVMEIDMTTKTSRLVEKKPKKKGKLIEDRLVCVEDNTPVTVSIARTDGRVGYCRQCRTVISTESPP